MVESKLFDGISNFTKSSVFILTVMKSAHITAKILHFLWAGIWSFFLVWVSLSTFSWSWLRVEPQFSALPAFALGWLLCAMGLLLDRPWAWYGCFVYTILSLFVTFYLLWGSIVIVQDEGSSFFWKYQSGSFYCELSGLVAAVVVLAVLLRGRHQLLQPDNTVIGSDGAANNHHPGQ